MEKFKHAVKAIGLTVAVLALVMGLSASPAQATYIIDFAGQGGNGKVSYDGEGGAVIGQDIEIDTVAGFGVPQNAGVSYAVTNGLLNFQTGSFSSYDSITNTYYFSGGGSFVITGGFAAAGIADSSTILVNGVFSSATFNGTTLFLVADGNDTKNADLVEFFGLDPAVPFTFFGFSIGAVLGGGDFAPVNGGAFQVTAFSTDIKNQVPEPGSLLLLGSGLAGLGLWARRKLPRTKA